MRVCRLMLPWAILLLSGCVYHVREHADEAVCAIVNHPYDLSPAPAQPSQIIEARKSSNPLDRRGAKGSAPKVDVQTSVYMQGNPNAPRPETDPGVQPASLFVHAQVGALGAIQPGSAPAPENVRPDGGLRDPSGSVRGQVTALGAIQRVSAPAPEEVRPKIDVTIPPQVPGSEAGRVPKPPEDKEAKEKAIQRLYAEWPALPPEPKPLPGPGGQPLSLADLQELAAANSAELRQAALAVEMARGNVLAARAYPNPTLSWQFQPSNDGSTAGVIGTGIDQTVVTGGKLRIASAAAEMVQRKSEIALLRARSDLATRVRNAYYTLLVAQETMRVNKALAHFTDQVFRLQVGMLEAGQAAAYEPMALRAQAWTTRVNYKQSIQSYVYAWEQLVATIGLRQVPLTEVSGRIDALIPYFDYDAVKAYVLQNHTDVLSAQYGIAQANYNLKAAQITPFPNIDFNIALLKEESLPPKKMLGTAVVGIPFPILDRNKGNIIVAEAALGQALEEPHRVAESLTNSLAAAYLNYKNNLDALADYRRHILPDQVRYYWGVFDRRQVDKDVPFGDLVAAQQTLATDVSTYLGILASLWSSVVTVADFLQTDDLFRFANPEALPPLPDFDHLPPWPCSHCCAPHLEGLNGHYTMPMPTTVMPPSGSEYLPTPRTFELPKRDDPAAPRLLPKQMP
jgi:cobalt-zinc-cadmium efflux system outer membrane protein